MTRIIITGANGKMGHVIRSVVAGREDCTVVAGVDFNTQAADFPIYKTIAEVQEEAEVYALGHRHHRLHGGAKGQD